MIFLLKKMILCAVVTMIFISYFFTFVQFY